MQILHLVVNQKCARKPNFYLCQNVYNCVFDPMISLLRLFKKFICNSKSKKKTNIFAAFKMSFFQEIGRKLIGNNFIKIFKLFCSRYGIIMPHDSKRENLEACMNVKYVK